MVVQYRGDLSGRWEYHGEFDADNLGSWLHHNLMPLVQVLSPQNFFKVAGSGLPVAILFVDEVDHPKS